LIKLAERPEDIVQAEPISPWAVLAPPNFKAAEPLFSIASC
jgi:hypothetical protein